METGAGSIAGSIAEGDSPTYNSWGRDVARGVGQFPTKLYLFLVWAFQPWRTQQSRSLGSSRHHQLGLDCG